MVTVNPDKYIRQAVYELINFEPVDDILIQCFDTRVTGNDSPDYYVLLTSQTKTVEKANKCEYRWETSLLIEIYNRYPSAGNHGSRVLLNNMEQKIYTLLLPKIEVAGFETLIQNVEFDTQLETVTDTEIIYRSFIRLNLTLI